MKVRLGDRLSCVALSFYTLEVEGIKSTDSQRKSRKTWLREIYKKSMCSWIRLTSWFVAKAETVGVGSFDIWYRFTVVVVEWAVKLVCRGVYRLRSSGNRYPVFPWGRSEAV